MLLTRYCYIVTGDIHVILRIEELLDFSYLLINLDMQSFLTIPGFSEAEVVVVE